MKHRIITLIGSAVLIAGGSAVAAVPADAAGAEHGFYPEDYDAYEHFDAGDGPCVDWAGRFHEVRNGGYRLVAPPGGRDPDELHVNGLVDGMVELIPDDGSLPTYTGVYREKVNGVVTEFSDEGDVERVAQYRLRSTLHGTDGSSLSLRLSGKITVNANGVATVERDVFSCE
jgi:hypothetical protein